MKKQYISPEMEIVTLHTQQVIAVSGGFGGGGKGGGAAVSREFDDDWDFE